MDKTQENELETAQETELENTQDLDLEAIVKEFSNLTDADRAVVTDDTIRLDTLEIPERSTVTAGDTLRLDSLAHEAPQVDMTEETVRMSPVVTGDTVPLETLGEMEAPAEAPAPVEEAPQEQAEPFSENWEPEYDEPMGEFTPPAPIVFRPKQRLRELKKKLIAGPEKRYYDLNELGLGKLQAAMAAELLVVLLCAGAAILLAAGQMPANRMRFMIFTQLLAMLVSALLGYDSLIDGALTLVKMKFNMNAMMLLTLLACIADGVLCLMELRVPCCAAFSLTVFMSLWQRYEQRSTEMGQMDTMRKATRLNSIVKQPDYFEGRPGLLRGQGEVEDFMDTYDQETRPEKIRNTYAFISFLACIGIAIFAGARHGGSMALRVLSTAMLVATPSSFFIAFSRPMAVLERRLHMVGTVICGWQGVEGLCGDAVFPLKDTDLFPQGAAKLNGVKFYGDRKPDEIIAYATALMMENGGGVSHLFDQLLKSRRGTEHDVENFRDYGAGGIGGEVNEEPVLLGSLTFLQDMGVEIPEGTMVNQAIYCAIDGTLSAVFAISYSKSRNSTAGVVSLCGYRKLTPVILCDDFMLDDSFLRSKFAVNTKRVAFPSREIRQELAAKEADPEAVTLAMTTQEGLNAYAYAVSGARSLRTACRIGLGIHMFGGILGMLIMLVLGYLGATALLTPMNVLLYQLVWAIPGVLATFWTRIV